ncbi:alpha/beta hydrolase-fold protein [Qipengyuania sp. JC766]|uniref:alpha/beta hydrolase n=1 Tax=Qipengyuania sp. JC766 TaxID=3232139 RepID=UPI003457463F
MRWLLPLLALLLAACATPSAVGPVAAGRFVEVERIAAEGLPDQRLTIWLPPDYDAGQRRYPVLYMHDGHNLFDPAKSNFGKVWAADRAMLAAMETGRVEPHIIVGIWAPGPDRYRQYLPQFAAIRATGGIAASIADNSNGGPVVSARYLAWIADELKPLIDREYRTRPGPGDTAIAGSSMGGIMSCYAIVERPDIFGRAACISSHWPVALPDEAEADRAQVLGIWRDWLGDRLGPPDGRRIWMDHGTATLDRYYAPYQRAVDRSFVAAGWTEGRDFRSEVYEGAEHEENAWAARLPEIFDWLLAD